MCLNASCVNGFPFSALEELYLGLPWDVWKMGVLVVVIVIFVMKYATPRVLRLIEEELTRKEKQTK